MNDSNRQHGESRAEGHERYVALGTRQTILLLKLAGLTNAHVIETRDEFKQHLATYSLDTIIITTAQWKRSVDMLESYPYTITLPDSLANVSDTSDIDMLKKDVLGIETGGS